MAEPTLPEKIVAVHEALDAAGLAHAFGGALALAWCTQRARGTIDIDVNVFVPASDAALVVAALPEPVVVTDREVALLVRDGQARVWWGRTPIDLFLDTTSFHSAAASRSDVRPFLGTRLPFLACRDLAVFKAFFDRPKDWVDLAEMAGAGSLDVAAVVGELSAYLGADDQRIERVRALAEPAG